MGKGHLQRGKEISMGTHRFSLLINELDCAERRRQLIAGLHDLSDQQLRDVGLWRGAVHEAAAHILSSQGCPAHQPGVHAVKLRR